MNTENNNNDVIKKGTFFNSYKKWIITSTLILILIAGAGTFAVAKMHKFHETGPLGFIMDKLTDDLDLNKDQKDQIERLKSTVKEKMEAEKGSKDNDADELINAFKNNNLDRNKLNDLEQKHTAKMQEMKEFTKDKIMEFYNILTPAQRIKVADKMSLMKSKMHDHMGKDHKKEK